MGHDTKMLTLTDFLLARIAEDETAAQDIAARIAADQGSFASIGLDHPELAAGDCPSWLAEYDPARVLAECEAKRRIVADHQAVAQRPRIAGDPVVKGFTAALAGAIEHLAAVYADHPDYREEWRL